MLTYSDESVDDTLLERRTRPLPHGPFVRAAIGVVAVAVLVLGVLLARGWRPGSDDASAKPAATSTGMPVSAAIEAKYGIRFLGVDVTSAGGMIQLRYQVLDSDKTEAIHQADVAPFVIDSSGKKYADPGMVGHSHVGKTKAPGTSDYILLANAGGGVKPGSTVTIKVGDLELQHVPVA